MANAGTILKAAGGVVATTLTILSALKENPQLADGVNKTFDKIKSATNSQNPKLRFDGKIKAIEACADAVDEAFPGSPEPENWRRKAKALQMRGELAWTANHGKAKKKAMQALNAETADLLESVNQRLVAMTGDEHSATELPPAS